MSSGSRQPLRTPKLSELGVARISYGGLLHRDAMEQFGRLLGSLAAADDE
jgi:2-methylisocitrate lyase-like PEP mutase family enzyme